MSCALLPSSASWSKPPWRERPEGLTRPRLAALAGLAREARTSVRGRLSNRKPIDTHPPRRDQDEVHRRLEATRERVRRRARRAQDPSYRPRGRTTSGAEPSPAWSSSPTHCATKVAVLARRQEV